jgi:hypothetical protein
MIEIKDALGLWERSLIAWPDGRQDTTTFVAWLQGPNFFADLRQPADPPSFDGVSCLDDLQPHHLDWLSRQEGFAGRFMSAGDAFEWRRMIDFQCSNGIADAGYLTFSDGVLVERGRDISYVEHWHQTSPRGAPHFALRIQDHDGLGGFLVRVGEIFMLVRNRSMVLPPGGSLADLVRCSSPEEGRALIDCEISLGRVRSGSWLIGRSTLPFRIKMDLSPKLSADHQTLTVADVAPSGGPLLRHWKIIEIDIPKRHAREPQQGRNISLLFPQAAIARET